MIKTKFKNAVAFIDNHSTAILLITLSGVIAAVVYDSSKRETVHTDEIYIPDSMIQHMVETDASIDGDCAEGTLQLTLTPSE